MADDQPDTGPDDDAPHGEPDKPTKDVDWQARYEQLQKDARRWEARSKENASKLSELEPLAKRAKELEDASKSDIERATAEAQAATGRADKAERELQRLSIALRKALPEADAKRLVTVAKRLVGETEDELEADADDLLASFRPPEPPDNGKKDDEPEEPARDPRRRPQERLKPGAVPEADTEPEETDPRRLAAMVQRHPTLG